MAQAVCKECGHAIGAKTTICPNCGAKAARGRLLHRLVLLVLVVIIAAGIFREDDEPGWQPAAESVAQQEERLRAVQQLIDDGIAARFEPAECALWVTPAFLALDFGSKQELLNPVWSYCIVEHTSFRATLLLNDQTSGKSIGYVNQYGLTLD